MVTCIASQRAGVCVPASCRDLECVRWCRAVVQALPRSVVDHSVRGFFRSLEAEMLANSSKMEA